MFAEFELRNELLHYRLCCCCSGRLSSLDDKDVLPILLACLPAHHLLQAATRTEPDSSHICKLHLREPNETGGRERSPILGPLSRTLSARRFVSGRSSGHAAAAGELLWLLCTLVVALIDKNLAGGFAERNNVLLGFLSALRYLNLFFAS